MYREFEIFWRDLTPEKQKELEEHVCDNVKDSMSQMPLTVFGVEVDDE